MEKSTVTLSPRVWGWQYDAFAYRPLGSCPRPLHTGMQPVSNANLGFAGKILLWIPGE